MDKDTSARTRLTSCRKFECTYTFENHDGTEAFQKVRYRLPDGGKTFRYRWRRGPGYVWVPGKPLGADDLLYHLPEVVGPHVVHWCEGEKDADAVRAAGALATSHHAGAGHITAEQARWLRHAVRVVLVADRDVPGAYDALLRGRLLTETGVPRDAITVVRAAVGKDAADHLAAGYSLDDFVPVPTAELRAVAARYTPPAARQAGYRWAPQEVGAR